ncbi:MAG: hypothetical protein ACOC1U_06660 [Spirochaetota bacterium]
MPTRRRRPKPPNRLARHTAALHVFIAGVLTIVAFLFQDSLVVRAGQVLAFAGLATLAGKRIRWGYFAIMVSSITFFNLLTPVGRVLVEIGPLPVTEGALGQGLLKGLAIVGLVFISLFAVRPDLRLPGTFGGILARLFFYFERVLETRRRVSAARLVGSVDEILMELYPPDDPGAAHAEASPGGDPATGGAPAPREATGAPPEPRETTARTDALGWAIMGLLVAVNWAFVFVY